MKNIEKWSGFEKYEDYKQHINTLPKINEDIDYSMNHENNFVALSMEVVIQIGNLWDDGVTEITPQMRNYLVNALKVLQNYNPKNSQINALIKNGLYYINNMGVLTDNICNDYD